MKRFKFKPTPKNILILVVVGIAIGLVVSALVLLILQLSKKPSPQDGARFVVPSSSWHPEIATNEYWDYGTLNNLKLYVNNTDRNVIYALDPETGKIVWTIWGKDYGIDGYEIRMQNEHLFLSSNAGDKDYTGLWVFDKNGRLAWNHAFLGYLDMPQMLPLPDGKVVLESRSGTESCLKGCGVLCEGTKPPEAWCTTHELWAFELETGKVLWVNRAATLYNVNLGWDEKTGQITASGGGWGGFNHYYSLDPSNGVVLTHLARLDENVYQGHRSFEFDQNNQTVSYVDGQYAARKVLWKVNPGNKLYELVSGHADYNKLRFSAYDNTLLIVETLENGSELIYGVNAKNGNIFWSADLGLGKFSLFRAHESGNELVLEMSYVSKCKEACDTCGSSWICIDTEPTKECKRCQAIEESDADYTPTQIFVVDRLSSKVNFEWHYGKYAVYVESIKSDKDEALVYYYQDDQKNYRVLDLKTGQDRPATADDLPQAADEEGMIYE